MNIEELVKKHVGHHYDAETDIRAALTELAAGYERKQALLFDAHCERVKLLQERIRQLSETHAIELRAYEATVENLEERIRQLDARLGGYLTVGGGHIVHGTAEALARVQAYILLDSKHPIEARDTNRYFAKRLQTAEQRIRQLESERVPDGFAVIDEKFRAMKSSTAERFLECLGIEPPDDNGFDWSMTLADLLAAAPAQEKEGEW